MSDGHQCTECGVELPAGAADLIGVPIISQTAIIFGSIIFAFFFLVAAKGRLGLYYKVFFG